MELWSVMLTNYQLKHFCQKKRQTKVEETSAVKAKQIIFLTPDNGNVTGFQ